MNPWAVADSSDEYAPSHSEVESLDEELPKSPVVKNPIPHGFTGSRKSSYRSEEEDDCEAIANTPSRAWKRRRLSPEYHLPQSLPYKRNPGQFSVDYIAVLNNEIDDAKEGISAEPDSVALLNSQLGMVTWTATEKRIFFDALGKLGRGDLPRIASRVGTKGIAEVSHYIHLLENELRTRRIRNRDAVVLGDIPAAAEISFQCCLALEAAADELSLRQQRYEERREGQKWEGFPWNITQDAAAALDRSRDDEGDKEEEGEQGGRQREGHPFARLFDLPNWLELSDRVFMNASFAENNWHFVDDEPPSMRSTAFADFHNLAVSLTRRLVNAAIFFAGSRIKAKTGYDKRVKRLVKRRDVLAAVESLGLSRDSSQFWAKSARRLKLDVYDDEDLDGPKEEELIQDEGEGEGDDAIQIMSFDEVENALGLPRKPPNSPPASDDELESNPDTDIVSEAQGSVEQDLDSDLEAAVAAMDEEIKTEVHDEETRDDVRELMLYTALDLPPTKRAIDAVKRRVAVEKAHEAYADACDAVASASEEMGLWEVLRLEPPEGLARKLKVMERARKDTISTDEYLKREDWREGVPFVSEWESAHRP